MIESIEIKNLRGIREGKLEGLTPLTVLVGPNGCGKSTILDALLITASYRGADALGMFGNFWGQNPDPIQLVAARHGRLQEWPRWLYWRGDPNIPCLILAKSDKHVRPPLMIQGVPPMVRPPPQLEPGRAPRQEAADRQPQPKSEWVPAVRLLEAHPPLPGRPLHQLYTQAVQQGYQDGLIQIVQSILPEAKRIEILTEGDAPVLHVVYPGRSVPVEFGGDGVHALLRMCMEIAGPKGTLVLIEEPEVHQHPATIRQAARAILAAVRRNVQIVFTTHSLELIDILLAEAQPDDLSRLGLYRLKLQDGALLSSRLTGSEVAFARNQIEDDLR